MKKTIGIISHRRAMAVFYGNIFRELLGDYAEICIGATEDESVRLLPKADLYISSVTSYDVLRDNRIRAYVSDMLHPIRMELTFSKAAVDLLQTYPEGTKALLANQNKHMAMECIAQLYHLGISNIEFYPCYPGVEELPELPLCFTVGEPDLVPAGIAHTLDIGSRLPNANVICEAALKLGNAFFLEGSRFKRYRSRLASVDYSLQTISSNNLTAENRLEIILNSLDEGIVCVNESGLVTLINKTARRLLDVSRSEVLGRPAAEVLPCLPFGDGDNGSGEPRLLNIQGEEIGAVQTPLTLEGETLGAFLTLQRFRDSERLQNSLRLQKNRKSYKAGHRFEDIVGSSPAICKAKDIAKRMAANDAPVLLQGETGVGKTIFAQAIHNASARAGGAFVTISCAALSDERLETELFGSADASAADASGGRAGLIECAHRGTLFLDGIEYMSPRLQASLLRVLNEHEIARVGSDETVPVDVRVISSSNGEALKKVREGSFRGDLYYRLSVVPIHIPSLRERKTDVAPLLDCFRARADADFELTTRARMALLQHHWEGNVRELKNCVEYLKYTGLRVVDLDGLPQAIRVSQLQTSQLEELERRSGIGAREYWVMRELGACYRDKRGIGRQTIAARCVAHGNAVSEHEVRAALDGLARLGYVDVRPGRGGSRLTEQGYLQYRYLFYGENESSAQ